MHDLVSSGILLWPSVGNENFLIQGNYIYDQAVIASAHGSCIAIGTSNVIVKNNTLHNCGRSAGIMLYSDVGMTRSSNMIFENNLLYDIINANPILFNLVGDNFTFNDNTIIGRYRYVGGDDYKYYVSASFSGDFNPSLEVHNNIFIGVFSVDTSLFSTFDEENNIYWIVKNGTNWPQTFGTNSIVARYIDTNYFEGSGNFFVGGSDFDQWSYERVPEEETGSTHGINLDNSYIPMNNSDACQNGIITRGHLIGQSCAGI